MRILSKKRIVIVLAFLSAIAAIHFDTAHELYKPQLTPPIPAKEDQEARKGQPKFVASAKVMSAVVANDGGSDEEHEQDVAGDESAIMPRIVMPHDSREDYVATVYSVERLITKFLQNADYSLELQKINQANLPRDVKQVLGDMQKFAESFPHAGDEPIKIFPKEGFLDRIVGHFVQIEKAPNVPEGRDAEHKQIAGRLSILENYFYSKQFLNETIDHD